MEAFGIRDALDIAIMALLLFYLYRIMKESGTINIFFGVLAFIVVWVFASQILEKKLFHHSKDDPSSESRRFVLPIVYACMNMAKTKTGALIVIEQEIPLENYEKSGDIIDALINTRLIENIFFKNSPDRKSVV